MPYIAEDVVLSPVAARALAALTGQAPASPEALPHDDLARLGDEELGALLPAAYTNGGTWPRFSVEELARERQARFSPRSCLRMFEALLADRERRGWADLGLGMGALLRCTGPWPDGLPERAGELVRFLLARDRLGEPYLMLAAAGLAGEGLRDEVAERVTAGWPRLARDELDLILSWDLPGQIVIAELIDGAAYRGMPALPDAWRRVADTGYAGFARRALEEAEARAAAVQSGRIPYRADKAFDKGEVAVLGRAARVALLRDEPWLPGLLDRLLRGVAVAPTDARTLPSQSLLFEIARAAELFPTPEAVASLRTARSLVRHKGVPKQLDRMLKRIDAALADRADVALRMPDLGFAPGGTLRTRLGDHEAVVTVTDDAELSWHAADGKALRSVPAAVRRDHGDAVKELRDLVKRVRAHLATLSRALEGGFTVEAARPYRQWREGLAAHPVAGHTVHRLIWEIETAPGTWRAVLPSGAGAAFHDSAGRAVPAPAEDAAVRLWHPIRSGPDEIRRWRDLLTERRLRQPFKQAFREIYRLTPAEAETGVHSERFAAHLVHYPQLFALFRTRGWRSSRLGPWDGGGADTADKSLAAGRWRVAFHHEYADDGIAATGRVRFARLADGAWRETPLADVPPLVFSEAMRDIDLFVGVTSLAADPGWADRGEDHVRGYWHRQGFGDLSAAAEVRRDALSRIIPRTRIADRCSLDGRFLTVRGDLRTYRIHLGSANILIEPDDAYLCVVPARAQAPGGLYLPFEEDRLSLILSKAFLLAADAEITDESIRRQIRRGA